MSLPSLTSLTRVRDRTLAEPLHSRLALSWREHLNLINGPHAARSFFELNTCHGLLRR